jgi:competence protein ComFC
MNLLDVLFPKRCVGCGNIGRFFCESCRKTIRCINDNEYICAMCGRPALDGITHPGCRSGYCIDGLISFFHYGGIIQHAIKTLKYRFVTGIAREFVSLVPDTILPKGILIPIPLHKTRLRERGFNQAEILARQFHVPIRTDILVRKKPTKPQTEMKKRKERLQNMQSVFSINSSIRLSYYPAVLLFDDVFTTGATMRDAAGALKRHGVQSVWAVTMAR